MFPRSTAALVLIAAFFSAKAAAQRHTIEVDPCVEVRVSEVTRILHVELLDGPQSESDRNVQVRVGCDGGLIALHLRDATSGWSLERRFQLADTTRGRARHLALEIAELSAVAFGDVGEDRTRTVKARSYERRPLQIGLAGMLEVRGSPSIIQGGGGLFVTHYWTPWIGGFFDGALLSGSTDVEFGTVRATTGISSVGVFVDPTSGPVSLRLGMGARLESVWLSGEPASPDQATGLGHHGWSWSGLARVRLDYSLTERVTFGLGVDGGWTVIPVRGLARGAEIVGIDGPWIRTSVTVALGLGS